VNPGWFSAVAVVLGWIVSCVWTIYNAKSSAANAKLTAAMAQQLASFELRIAKQYVSERTCRERMGLLPLPLVEVVQS
jgi:hypothetical protein